MRTMKGENTPPPFPKLTKGWQNSRNLSSFVTSQHCVTTPQIERVMNFFGGLMQKYTTS